MSTTQDNILTLAAAVRHDRKLLAQVCATAKRLNLPSPKRQPKPISASSTRLQNFVRRIPARDLQNAVAKFGSTSVFSRINSQSILEVAAEKFTAMALNKAGGK